MESAAGKGIRSGVWIGSAKGSRLEITVTGKQVIGTYQTSHGRPSFDEKFDVTGFTDGSRVGLVVLWDGYESLTTWAGRYGRDDTGEYITAMWHLVRKYSAEGKEAEEWESFLTNSAGKWYLEG